MSALPVLADALVLDTPLWDLHELEGARRLVIERSCMSNNDELYVHWPQSMLDELNADVEKHGWKIVCDRPVYVEELEAGLDVTRIETSIDTVWKLADLGVELYPELTQALDGLYKLRRGLDFYVNTLGGSPGLAVVDLVAQHFYDCMSGGADRWYLEACTRLLVALKVPLDEPIYPKRGDGGWHTVGDFLEEIQGKKKLEGAR